MSEQELPLHARCETWENTYSGFDRKACRDYTGMTLQGIQNALPAPVPSPTCVKRGHDWLEVPSGFRQEHFPKGWTRLFGCKRCAKRGLVVLKTDAYMPEAAEC